MNRPKHKKTFEIQFRDIDLKGHLKMSALVDMMQEVSGEHASLLGVNYEGEDNADNVFWIVSRAKMQLNEHPKHREMITIETYPAGIDKLFAVRRFDVYDKQEKLIGWIIGYYVLIDCKTKLPMRINRLTGEMAKLNWPYEGEETLDKLKAPQVVQREETRRVYSTEIDLNNHMNNAHYIRWGMDLFDVEELKNKTIKSIQTNYTTALVEGDIVHLIRGVDEAGHTLIQGKSLDGSVTYWTSQFILEDIE